MDDLAGKVSIVTGASAPRGIGRAIAMRLAEAGSKVLVTDIEGELSLDSGEPVSKSSLLQSLAEDIEHLGGTAHACVLDVTDPKDIQRCVALSQSRWGSVDVLVNNAGSLSGSDNFLSTTPTQWRTSFEVNVLGPMMLSQTVIPLMRENGGGRIINIGSTGSLGAEAGFGAYTTMKHGLVGFTKTLAAEFGVDGITCNLVCPGYIMTDMHAAANTRLAKENAISVSEMKTMRYANVALRNAGEPSDVAEAVLYLAGPSGAYVTGICLPVAGGVSPGI